MQTELPATETRPLRPPAVPAGLWQRFDGVCDLMMQNIWTAVVQIWANRTRALLTTLGIVIGVTSTITVVSFVEGFGNYATGMLRNFGTNLIVVVPQRPGGAQGRRLGRVELTINDIRAVGARCDKVRRISPLIFTGATLEYGRDVLEQGDIELRGATEQFQTIRNFPVEVGRCFSPIDVDRSAKVCVLGRDILTQLECDESIVGDHVFINQQRFRVLGVLEEKGNMMGENQDNLVLIPYTTALQMMPSWAAFMAFMVEATSEEDVEECALQVARTLRLQHDLQPEQPNDFRMFRQDQFLRQLESVKIIATSVLAGIVGISLVVGGIGIMNIMLVSVSERTREIGLRKSLGARRRDIMFQFLIEAVMLSSIGGILGIVLGSSICSIASLHPSMVEITVPVWVVLLAALGFCATVGVVFGMIPAFKAAIVQPIDALRYE